MSYSRISKLIFTDHRTTYGLGIIFLCMAGSINLILKRPIIQLNKQDTALNVNKNVLIFGSAGNKRLITDLLWVQTLIESDTEHYKKKDLNNWLFLRFNSIAALDPMFYENYLFGGQYLGIIKDDLDGADQIYKQGLNYFPNDYSLNYHLGFLNYFEMGRLKEGLQYLEKIQDHPRAPHYIKSIINKLKASTGTNLEEIFLFVLSNYEMTKDETLKQKLEKDLYAIRAEIDLKCLNDHGSNCRKLDLEGNPYVKKGETYSSSKMFLPFRINKRGDHLSPLEEIDTIK